MFGWTYLDQSGEELGRSPKFGEVEAAEEWIGSSWRDLLENGIDEVALVDDVRGRTLYRMGLGAE